jgi:hypothetical protein
VNRAGFVVHVGREAAVRPAERLIAQLSGDEVRTRQLAGE